jgi:tripartite-type tricarboxylate transporter receptor subunit TctC
MARKAKTRETAQKSRTRTLVAERGYRDGRAGAAFGLTLLLAIGVAALAVGAMASPGAAQSYPTQPIRFILPWAPGGTTDILARIVGPRLSEQLGQPVVIENRPGGGSHVGTDFVAKARPDGYTIVMVTPETAMGPSLFRKLNYNVLTDFKPISLVAQVPLVLLSKPDLPVKSLKELVAYAQANPGKINYGSGGIASSSHLAIELLMSETKTNMVHTPYKATGPGMVGLLAGEVDLLVPALPTALPHIEAGKVRALAVLSKERNRALPNVPVPREFGIDVEVINWWGILVPAATPANVASRLHTAWTKVAAMPETAEAIKKTGCDPLTSSPEQFGEFIKQEVVRWAKIIKAANVPPLD